MARGEGLETLQARYADFRRRAEPGLVYPDIVSRLSRAAETLELIDSGNVEMGVVLGDMLIDLCCLAEKERLDLAHHARQAFRRLQQEYEAGQ